MNKFDVDYVPGWDCHGLPIEWKVEEEFKKKGKEKSEVGLDKFRKDVDRLLNIGLRNKRHSFKDLVFRVIGKKFI